MNTSSTSIVVVVVAVVVVVLVVVVGVVVVVKGEVVVVAGSVIGCLWNSVRSPEHELLEQLCAFRGCGIGSVIGCLWNSVHSPENKLLEQLYAFRGCGRICHWLLVEFRPQPRKRAVGAIVCFSGLWQDLSLAACGFPSTAQKTSFWNNSLLFGAVVGSVIGCSPENELLEQLCACRGCGRICHWLLVEFRPQPRTRAFGAIVCFSGLW